MCNQKNKGINKLRLRQNGCHFPDDIFKCIHFVNENEWISLKILLILPTRRQAIVWNNDNDGYFTNAHMRHSA